MELQIVVDNRVRVEIPSVLQKTVLPKLKERFEHDNPQYAKIRSMGHRPPKSEPRTYRVWQDDGGGWYSFPRGGMQAVREVLQEAGCSWSVSDQRVDGTEELAVTYRPPGVIAPYQVEADLSMRSRQNAILKAPTGSRKTSVAMMIAAGDGVPVLVMVDDSGLADQWVERAVEELGLSPGEVGKIGGGEFRLRPFTIGMLPSIVSRAKDAKDRARMTGYFGSVILDEAHGAAANRAYEAVDMFPARRRYAISADIERKDRKEFLTYWLFGAIAFEIDREELVAQGIILDVEIRVVETQFSAPWYGGSDGEVDFNRLLDEMQVDDARNALIADLIAQEVRAGEQVVALAHRRDHCRILDAALAARSVKSGFLIGGDDYAAEYDRTLTALRSGERMAGIGTIKAISQGIDFPSVGAGILATPVAANKLRFNQGRGRFCRKPEGKTHAVLYVVVDTQVYAHHLKNIVAWNPTVTIEQDGAWVPIEGSRRWAELFGSRRRNRAASSEW